MSRAYASWHKLLIVFCLGLLIFFVASEILMQQVLPVTGLQKDSVLVEVPPGSSTAAIGSVLKKADLIRNETVFRYYVKLQGLDLELKAGKYFFDYGLTLEEIIDKLAQGDVYRPTVTVTIPEGFTLEQIAQRLEDSNLVDYQEFFDLAVDSKPAIIQQEEQLEGLRYAMEGYLFPATYEFDQEVTPEEVLNRLESQMSQVFTEDIMARIKELGLTIHEVLTLASLVERETQVPAEREIVAAVMHNRLEISKPLEIDATVLYALGEHKTQVLYKDLEVDSPYNTYRVRGLPPGPIASPGKQSILAVLYPAEVDYRYYVTKKDGSGGHYFARTHDEHKANISKSLKNRSSR